MDGDRVNSALLLPAARLFSKTSAKGTPYLTGRMGGLKVLVMFKPASEDGAHTHVLLLTQAPAREAGR